MAVDPLAPPSKILSSVKKATAPAAVQRPAPAASPAPPVQPAEFGDAQDLTGDGEQDQDDNAPARRKRAVRLEDVEFGTIEVAKPSTFAAPTKKTPDDHPLMIAFRRSYNEGIGLDVPTPDVEGLKKIIRRIASQEGKGVHIKTREGVVAFKATERRVVRRKKE